MQVINLDEKTQILFAEGLGPFNTVLQQRIYVRSLDDHGKIYEAGYQHTVHEFEPELSTGANGLNFHLPRRFTWSVNDDNGTPLVTINGISNGDFKYGMAGGYAGVINILVLLKDKQLMAEVI